MHKYILIIFTILTGSLFSETSIFSSKGLGDIKPDSHLRTGVGKLDSLGLSSSNFAMWSDVKNTTYSVSLSYDLHDVKGNNGESSKFDGMTISGFNIAMPFGEKNLFGLSFSPFSKVNILQSTTEPVDLDVSEPIKAQTRLEKVGGLNNLSLIYAKRLGDLSFSTDFSAKFGTIKTYTENFYSRYSSATDTIPDATMSSEITDKSFYNHLTAGIGVSYKILDNLNFGGYVAIPFYSFAEKELSTKVVNTISSYTAESKTVKTEELDAEWPLEFSLGLSYDFNKTLNISSDFNYIGFKDKDLKLELDKASKKDYEDYTKFSISSTYTPSRKKIDSYYKKVSYTVGGVLEKRSIKAGGNDIYDKTLMLGLNLPYDRDRASIKANFYYTMSGDKSDNVYEENILKFELVFTGSSSWWLKKNKYDD